MRSFFGSTHQFPEHAREDQPVYGVECVPVCHSPEAHGIENGRLTDRGTLALGRDLELQPSPPRQAHFFSSGRSKTASRYSSTSSIAMGCVGVATQRGQIITGRRSVSARINSKDRLPEPMMIEARSLDDLDTGLTQNLTSLLPASQVLRKGMVRVAETTQVDDPSDVGLLGGRREIGRSLTFVAPKIPSGPHRMDEVVRGINTFEGQGQRFGVKDVTGDQLGGLADPGTKVFRSSGQTTDANRSPLKQRQQTRIDPLAACR